MLNSGSFLDAFRQAVIRHRGLLFAFVVWESFFFVDGLSVVEARELNRLEIQRDRAWTAESFGIPAELWTAEPESRLERVRRELSATVDGLADQTRQLLTSLTPSVGTVAASTTVVAVSTTQDEPKADAPRPKPRRIAPLIEDGTQ